MGLTLATMLISFIVPIWGHMLLCVERTRKYFRVSVHLSRKDMNTKIECILRKDLHRSEMGRWKS